ncbi:MAG: M23 family metallopeptidase [Spirochaetaceae bacterium]|jgi:hypothetical protein|nr:M23 family metallopeptidase [Spirochaetaceae bacterium]
MSKTMKKLLILVFILPCSIFAMDWPTSNGRLTANFGSNDGDLSLYGYVFNAEGDVYASDNGEVLFYSSENDESNFVSPLGNWVVIDHGDSVLSIYSRLGELAPLKTARVEKGENIAVAGKSGWSAKDGFIFAFFDRHERQWVNPVQILSAVPDTMPPVIYSVMAKNQDGQLFDLAQTKTLRQGRYAVLVHSTDRSENAEGALAPFRIVCSLNGIETGRLELETINARDGIFLVYRNGLVPLRQVYAAAPALEAVSDVSFTRGQNVLNISVQDFERNVRNASYRLYIE